MIFYYRSQKLSLHHNVRRSPFLQRLLRQTGDLVVSCVEYSVPPFFLATCTLSNKDKENIRLCLKKFQNQIILSFDVRKFNTDFC